MRAALAAVSLGLLSLAPVTRATAADDATEKARASFFQGVELYKEGSFEAALAEFQRAYQTSPNYRVLYNIAQSYFQLRDYASSYRTLRDYVEQGGSELSPDRHAQVDELYRKLEKRVAQLDISCNLDGTEIRIDDIAVGRAPLVNPVLVNAGPRKVSAVKPGYAVTSRTITVAGGEQASVRLELDVPTDVGPGKPAPPTPSLTATHPAPPAVEVGDQVPKRSRTGLIVSLSAAGGCAIATGAFGWQMLQAKSDFDREVAKRPYDRTAVYDARSRALTYQYLTDGFAAATLVAGGVALYLVLRDDGSSGQRDRSKAKVSVAVAPVTGGLQLLGAW